jgi:two-component system sensor histidine kinase/response regulator
MDTTANLLLPTPRKSSATAAAPPQNRGRVLIVEDNPINQRVAVILANKLGFVADVAGDGSEALTMVRDHEYTLILMDCQMPVMDGFEATRAIRALETPIAQVPIIAVTANVMEGQRDKCLAAGMNDYLPKPINKDVLGRTVDKWIPPADNSLQVEPAQALSA